MTASIQSAKLTTTVRAALDWWHSAPSLTADLEDRRGAIRERLVAWWNGEILETCAELGDQAEDEEDDGGIPEGPFAPRRLKAIEDIWGSGFLEPGGERYARKLLAVLSVTSKQTVLDLTAGLGGTARAIATHRKLWMDALEPIAELAAEGQLRSAEAGLGKRVAIKPFDCETLVLTEKRYDAIFTRERLCGLADKNRILDQVADALKERGQFLMTDFVAAEESSDADAAWPERDDAPVHLWSLAHYRHALEQRGIRIQIAQDITPEYLDHIHSTWVKIPSLLASGKLSRRNTSYVIDEGELWQKRTDALVSGTVGIVRIHAIRLAS